MSFTTLNENYVVSLMLVKQDKVLDVGLTLIKLALGRMVTLLFIGILENMMVFIFPLYKKICFQFKYWRRFVNCRGMMLIFLQIEERIESIGGWLLFLQSFLLALMTG